MKSKMFKTNTNPEMRFTGFQDDWGIDKVGYLLEERNTQFPKSSEYPLMAFIAYIGVAAKGNRYNRESLVNDVENKKYKQTEYGDFIYSSNNLETGSIGLNKYGKASISPVYSIFRSTGQASPDFIGRLLSQKSFIQKMISWRQGVVYGQWRIHESDFLKIEIKFPNKEEQKKVGDFFKILDDLLDLQQLKFNKLQTLKNSFLEKIFPKEGERFPELGIKNFKKAWQPVEFSSLVDRVTASSDLTQLPRIEFEDIISGRGKLNKDITQKFSNKSGIQFEKGDILYGKLRPYLKNWFFASFKGIAVGDFWVLRAANGISDKFIYSLIQTNNFSKITNQSTGSKMPRADWNIVSKSMFCIPSDYEEQMIIGDIFYNLEKAINMQSQKLDKLKNLKNAFADKFFA